MKTNTKWFIIVGLLILLAIAYVVYQRQTSTTTSSDSQRSLVVQRGFLAKDSTGANSSSWYLDYEQSGNLDSKIELKFDSSSTCKLGTAVEDCDLTLLTVGQGVQIEGVSEGNVLRVVNLLALDETK